MNKIIQLGDKRPKEKTKFYEISVQFQGNRIVNAHFRNADPDEPIEAYRQALWICKRLVYMCEAELALAELAEGLKNEH